MTELKKVSAQKIKLSDLPEGAEIEGTFKGFTESDPFNVLDEKSGEIIQKTLTQAHFVDDKGEKIVYVADKGFKGALQDSMIKENTWIKAVKLPKVKLTKGRTMNAYDVYTR